MEVIVFYCPYCQRIEKQPVVSTNVPNTKCQHYTKDGQTFSVQMIVLEQKEIPETLEQIKKERKPNRLTELCSG